jgi:hypothetical protein
VTTRELRFIALCFTLGVLCVLVGACNARAAATDEARLGWFLPIARAAWPASPCAGHETIHLHAATLDTPSAGAPLGLDGLAQPVTCEVWLRPGMDPERFCETLVHEEGHLDEEGVGVPMHAPVDQFGRAHGPIDTSGHTSTPGDIMNGDGDVFWAPCFDAVTAAQARGRSRWAMLHRSRLRRRRFHPDPAPR